MRRCERDLLCNKATNREAQHVDLWEPERFDERYSVGPHLLKRGRHLARTARDAGVVEQDDFPLFGEAVGHRRIPMVHRAGIVLVEDERHAARFAKAAIGEADAVSLDILGRRGLVRVIGHDASPLID